MNIQSGVKGFATSSFDAINPSSIERKSIREGLKASLAEATFISPRMVAAGIRVIEALFIFAVAMASSFRYPGFLNAAQFNVYFLVSAAIAIGLPLAFDVAGAYRLHSLLEPAKQIPRLAVVWAIVFGTVLLSVFMLKAGTSLSRVWLVTFASAGFFVQLSFRQFMSVLLRRQNKNGQFNRRAVIVGGGESAGRVIATLDESRNAGISLIGMFDDRDDFRSVPKVNGLYKLGDIDDLIDFVRATKVDTLIITLPVTAEDRLLNIVDRLWVLPVDIRLSANGQKLRYRPRAYSYIGNLPCLDVFDRPLGDWGPFLKAGVDKILAVAAITLLSPVMLAVAAAVKFTSKGPVLFKQKRYGFNNELIEIYKFRSMYNEQTDANATTLVTKVDPRVTKVGRFIRRTSLDELPQFFNVLKGQLSLVGPRPHATKAKAGEKLYEHVVDGYFARHKVKPGITGWAQINGWRGETDTHEKIEKRVEFDLYYIENWSLTFDLYILARTPFALLNTDQAY